MKLIKKSVFISLFFICALLSVWISETSSTALAKQIDGRIVGFENVVSVENSNVIVFRFVVNGEHYAEYLSQKGVNPINSFVQFEVVEGQNAVVQFGADNAGDLNDCTLLENCLVKVVVANLAEPVSISATVVVDTLDNGVFRRLPLELSAKSPRGSYGYFYANSTTSLGSSDECDALREIINENLLKIDELERRIKELEQTKDSMK